MTILVTFLFIFLLPLLAGFFSVLFLFILGDTRPFLPVGLGSAGLVFAALLVPLASTGIRAHIAYHAGQRLLAEAERLGSHLPVHVLWIPGQSLLPWPPPESSAHLHLSIAAAVESFSPPPIPPSWKKLSRRILTAHPHGNKATHGILRLPHISRLVRVVFQPNGSFLLLDGP